MTTTIRLPTAGLLLSEFPVDLSKKRPSYKQAIEIATAGDTSLDHIILSIRDGVEATAVLGKKPVILLDKKAIPLKTTYHPQSLLFTQSKNSEQLQLTASLNLKDASAKIKLAQSRDIDMNDPAILALQASMAQVKEQKDANQTIVVNSGKLPNTKNARTALASLKDHRKGMFGGGSAHGRDNSVSRSTPGSPAIGGVTPQPVKRDAKAIKQEAIKRPFIHLLAVRAVSENYIAKTLHASKEDIAPLLSKYGKLALDGTKYNLSDRGYKELDPWAFPYQEEGDRNGVIERAVIAFDRLRISVKDPLWQKLLKKEERGKGKTLSKLSNLHHGPIDRAKTPKIPLEPLAEENSNSNNADRGRLLAPSDAIQSAARSKSQESSKKAMTGTPKPSQSKPTEASQKQSQKDTDKKGPAKKADAKKPPVKKQAAKPAVSSAKVKSAEFIEDSDEEIESDEIATAQQNGSNNSKRKAEEDLSPPSKKVDAKKPVKPTPKQPVEKKVAPKPRPTPSQAPKPAKKPQEDNAKPKAPASTNQSSTSSAPKKKLPEPPHRSVPMARSISAKKGNPSVKPSPLGSSPPTNASDMEQEKTNKADSVKSSSSSSSGSPLINQRRERLQQEAKRQASQVSSSPNPNSDRNLKRRANDLDNGNHPHGGFASGGSSSSSDLASKRPKLSESSPSASESDQKSTTSSNTSPSLVLSPKDIEYARSFKQQWQKYTSALRELQALSDPPAERVEKLQTLYAKLKAHKAEICSWDKKEGA